MKVIINKLPLKHIKGDFDKLTKSFTQVLYVLVGLSIIFNTAQDIVYGIKAVLIYLVCILISRETEIFFISMKSNATRAEGKEAIKTTKPEITGLIFALLLPIGTPLFVVAVGAFISIFIGKMVFGGYSFNVFNPAIVGRLFVGIAWPALVTVSFPNILDNYLLSLIFNRDLTTQLMSPLMELQANGIVSLSNMSSIPSLLFSSKTGMLFSMPSIVYLVILIYFIFIKTIDLKPILFTALTSFIVFVTVTIGFNLSISYVLYHYLAGGFLFITLFMMTDPFTKPFNTVGTIFYAVIFTFSYTLIRFLGKDADGVMYALLFTNLFVPLLNKKTKESKFGLNLKSILTVVLLSVFLFGTGLFINSILNQRIMDKQIVVNEYVES